MTPRDQAMADAFRTQIGWFQQGGAPFSASLAEAHPHGRWIRWLED